MNGEVGRELDAPARWVRTVWDEPNLAGEPAQGLDYSRTTFLYELTGQGHVLRAIELMGDQEVPIGAASLAEFWAAQRYQRQAATLELTAYQAQYGGVPEGSESDWGDYPHDEIGAAEFEAVWERSRAHLRERPRSEHFA